MHKQWEGMFHLSGLWHWHWYCPCQDAWYWRFVEFGTRKMAARPFLRPALESRRRQAVDAIKQRLTQRIEIEARALNGR